MIYISKLAQQHFKTLLADKKIGTQIRVFVINPGTSGAECGVSYYNKDEIKKNDVEITYSGFNVYIRESDVPYLKDAKIDIELEGVNSELTLSAPFAKYRNNNANLSLKNRVQSLLDIEINPNLSLHGGRVVLIDVTESGYVKLKFSGGCNGCSMINVTLKENIEKKLLLAFPELRGITDLTMHKYGSHSYY
ncbi:NfuA family Fe-S biogenesis protein [Buchnera aphidicola]|uniref:NfuA family Fe-S biogenesis protein n=1 Tax=Buchnera aphidicola TaxID=9 RepID=UPI003463DD2A